MADRSVKVVVRADVNPLKSAMADGGKSIDGLAGKASGLGGKIKSGLSYAPAAETQSLKAPALARAAWAPPRTLQRSAAKRPPYG